VTGQVLACPDAYLSSPAIPGHCISATNCATSQIPVLPLPVDDSLIVSTKSLTRMSAKPITARYLKVCCQKHCHSLMVDFMFLLRFTGQCGARLLVDRSICGSRTHICQPCANRDCGPTKRIQNVIADRHSLGPYGRRKLSWLLSRCCGAADSDLQCAILKAEG
jgi:hypothetical protein